MKLVVQQKTTPPKIRIISPCFNEAEGIAQFASALLAVLRQLPDYRFEIAFIDDGSSDQTLNILNRLAAEHPHILIYSLSRNFGHQAALLAGLDTTASDIDAVIMMDSDLQHPPQCIPEMLRAHASGIEIVSMVRRSTGDATWSKRLTSALFYRVFRGMTNLAIYSGAADFCLIGRRAVAALHSMPERDLFLRGALCWIGFPRMAIEYDVAPRFGGVSKYSVARMIRLASQGIFSFSTAPIQWSFRMGTLLSALALAYLAYAFFMYASDGTVRGWTSLIAVVVFFGGINLFTLGVLGEYIARTFDEVKQRPRYLFKQQPHGRHTVAAASRDNPVFDALPKSS
jgi:dolichol-phosphate mannosyltransferase